MSSNIRIWALKSLPTLLCLGLILLNASRLSLVPYFHQPLPLVFIVIFYFAVYDPRLLNCGIVFGLGVMADLITQSPFGLSAFIYVGMFFMANLMRSYLIAMSFISVWTVFCIYLAILYLLWYGLAGLMMGQFVPAGFMAIQYIFLCLYYPLLLRLSATLNYRIRGLA